MRWMQTKGLSQRRCLGVVRMSASSLRYVPRSDRNKALREKIAAELEKKLRAQLAAALKNAA